MAALETDAVVIGAGPVGLFQVFQLGLLEIKAHLIDSLPAPGGQCAELYGDKPIYDIPGLPVCSGQELVDRLRRQIEPFGAPLHLGEVVTGVRPRVDGGFDVETDRGTRLVARVVVVAGGVGAFQPRRLKLAGIDAFEGTQLLHRVGDAAQWAGQVVVIVGGEEAALHAAAQLAAEGPQRAASVLLVHRRDAFNADPALVARVHALRAAGALRFAAGQVTGFAQDGARLTHIDITGIDEAVQREPLDALLVLQGLSPKLGPIAGWGLALQRKQLIVDTERFETSVPGIFAVGDIVTYTGKKKLIVCGFHEATLAAFAAAERIFPNRSIPLQYTTTSPRLHALLGVAAAAGG